MTESTFDDQRQKRLSQLLERNREGILETSEKQELDEMMQVYENGLLRKSKALRVAVERGLIAPLSE